MLIYTPGIRLAAGRYGAITDSLHTMMEIRRGAEMVGQILVVTFGAYLIQDALT
ncbi:MAG: hypothetical protein JO170_09405 [Verrucomicrobia bacterium]|nr:hypothetical protein [Verrucomicrobiota bacterium]